ncbi:hypothetical protein [uncultured Chryseobacterium sp.]|jgi:hypothetical protein|uniref:hypothetical protein n=1 Tax=uncultured Chryseobacterium sp. TaxID=259322 RepID=UPI002587D6DF|nr:hypothetical protein [uncultured Chryseobacterium sp.]
MYKKTKSVVALVAVALVSTSLFTFAKANDSTVETNKTNIAITEKNAEQLESEAAAGFVLLWSKDIAALGGWE